MSPVKRIPRAELQLEYWPEVDARALADPIKQAYLRRRKGVLAYASPGLSLCGPYPDLVGR